MRLQLCGVRGSTPAPGPEFVRYGGNTSCVALSGDEDLVPTLILDAGTGLRQVTPILNGEPFRGTIVLSHLHWDHVQGLPFFQGGDTEGADVTLLIPEQPGDAAAEDVLALSMSPPHFPITPSQLRGQWSFGMLPPGEMRAGQFTILALEIPHKGGMTYGYRVSDGRSAMAYLPDHCPTNLGPGPEGWASTTKLRSLSRREPTPCFTTPRCCQLRYRPRPASVTRPLTTRSASACARELAGSCCFTIGPIAPIPSLTSWLAGWPTLPYRLSSPLSVRY